PKATTTPLKPDSKKKRPASSPKSPAWKNRPFVPPKELEFEKCASRRGSRHPSCKCGLRRKPDGYGHQRNHQEAIRGGRRHPDQTWPGYGRSGTGQERCSRQICPDVG